MNQAGHVYAQEKVPRFWFQRLLSFITPPANANFNTKLSLDHDGLEEFNTALNLEAQNNF